jgi:Bacterial membrane protein YfhO
LSRMHVGYLVSPRELDLPIVTRTPDATIYRNDRVLPRAWIAPMAADLSAVSELVPGSRVESLTDSGNAVTIRANSPQPGWLILSDTFYPGWQATIDGTSVEIQIANEAFRAIEFPAGDHTIEFQYQPRSVLIGLSVSLMSLAIIVMGLVVSYWRSARR